jgi:hypothetical protein
LRELVTFMQMPPCPLLCGAHEGSSIRKMDEAQELLEQACHVIKDGYRSVRSATGSNHLADLITIAQGYLRIVSQQPTPAGEAKLRDAVATLRAALTKSKSA